MTILRNDIGRIPTDAEQERLKNNFTYHPPKGDQTEKYELIRDAAKAFAWVLLRLCPESRELSLAITHLEDAVMWANSAIARNEP